MNGMNRTAGKCIHPPMTADVCAPTLSSTPYSTSYKTCWWVVVTVLNDCILARKLSMRLKLALPNCPLPTFLLEGSTLTYDLLEVRISNMPSYWYCSICFCSKLNVYCTYRCVLCPLEGNAIADRKLRHKIPLCQKCAAMTQTSYCTGAYGKMCEKYLEECFCATEKQKARLYFFSLVLILFWGLLIPKLFCHFHRYTKQGRKHMAKFWTFVVFVVLQ